MVNQIPLVSSVLCFGKSGSTRPMITLIAIGAISLTLGCGDNGRIAQVPLSAAPAGPATTKLVPATAPSLWTRIQGEDWPRFLGTTFDGKSTETGIRKDWTDGKLPAVWSMDVGTSYGIGAIAAGRYFQHERIGDTERLTAVRAETGEVLWTNDQPVQYADLYGYNNGPRDTPAIDNQEVFTFGVAGRLTCVDAIAGTTKWSVDTNAAYGVIQNFFGVGCSPLVIGDKVIVMVGGSPQEDASIAPGRLDRVSSNGSAVVAFDRSTGKELWKTGEDLASYSSPRPITVAGKTFVIMFARQGLLAIDPESGKQLWHFPYRAEIMESVNAIVPVVIGNRVFISECYEHGAVLLEVSADGCDVIWQDSENRNKQAFRAHWATPIAIDNFLYGCSGRNEPDSDFRCIDWLTGKVSWSDKRRSRASLMYVDQHLIVLDESGEMQLLRVDPQQLSLVTSINLHEPKDNRPALGTPYWAAPVLSHGLLYVRGSERVLCLELIPATSDH